MSPLKKNLPNALTWLRIFLVPLILAAMALQAPKWQVVAAVLFIVAAISDYLDGVLARRWQVISDQGKLLDPIADKVLVTGVMIALVASQHLDPYIVIVLIARDALVNALRSVAAAKGQVISAGPTGKWKAAIQMIFLPLVMLKSDVFGLPTQSFAYGALWFSVVLALVSGTEYFWGYIKIKKNSHQEP